jgi:cyclopropane-fatty-acyl-phospholipid synthase
VHQPSHLSVVDDVTDIAFERPAFTSGSRHQAPSPDSALWPEVFTVPSGAVAAASAIVADRLLRRTVAPLPIQLVYPDGPVIGAGGATAPTLVVNEPDRLARRLGRHGLIGFGESYMAGDWDSADLTGVLTVFAANVGDLVPPWQQRLRQLAVRRHPEGDQQTREGARRNIGRHYDLSNELFALFLDETMTYSSAVFDTGADGAPIAPDPLVAMPLLADAQRRKIDLLLDRAGVGPGCRVLEVGTGWGELALRAARRGASVVTITISAEQQALAVRRVAEAGLSGQVSVQLRDYRDIDGQFDAICSVEMLEAVGERYWDAYFAALDQHLAPGGRIGLQTITMGHDRMLATRRTYTWIHKYIFPGGLLPSVTAIESSLAAATRLRITARDDFGAHYAETLKVWRDRFCAHQNEVDRLGFDEVFRRMWTFYLSYSEAGFRAGYIGVSQLTLARV